MSRHDPADRAWEADLESELRATFRRRAGDVGAVALRVAEAGVPTAVERRRPAAPEWWRPRPALVAAVIAVVAVVALTAVAVSRDERPSIGTPATDGPPTPPVVNDAGETVRRVWEVEQDGRQYTIEQVTLQGQGDRVGFNLVVDGRRLFSTLQPADCIGGDAGASRGTPNNDGGFEVAGDLPAGATGAELSFPDGTVTTVDAISAPGLPLAFYFVADAPDLPADVRRLGVTTPPAC